MDERCTCTIGVDSDCPEHGHGAEGARLTAGIIRHEEKYAAERERLNKLEARRWKAQTAQAKLDDVLRLMKEDYQFEPYHLDFVRSIFYSRRKRR